MRWACNALLVAAFVVLPACDETKAHPRGTELCGTVETLIEPTQGHVLPGVDPGYRHHPPTSGRHLSTVVKAGIRKSALPEVEQVAALEAGLLIMQYDASTAQQAITELEGGVVDREDIIVMPAAGTIDNGAQVAFTAWQHRQLCRAVSPADAAQFVAEFAGKEAAAPHSAGPTTSSNN